MAKYIITYNDAQEICKKYNNFNFSEHFYNINGYNISTFNYFICDYNDFINPLPGKEFINAFDMRGVTFIFDKNNQIWRRFLMLPKFFNLNQVETTQYSKIKDKKIYNISIKEDGSLIAFMMLPNKKLVCKTICGFSNEQSLSAMEIINNNKEHIKWILKLLENNLTPLFEYVSRDNRIVLKYLESQIRFIGLRDNISGDFIPASYVEQIPSLINIIKSEKQNLDELIEKSKIEENKEGWVVMFEDGMLLKIKTLWYFNNHFLRTENIFREDFIIENYYKQTLDDIICQLNTTDDSDALEFINNVIISINNYSNYIEESVIKLFNIWKTEFKDSFSDFAIKYKKEPHFEFVKFFENKQYYNQKKINFVLKNTYRLKSAKEIVKKYENKI